VYLVAEVDGKLVGTVLGSHDGRKGWINRLAVSPAHRRRGIGGRLVAEVESRFAALGIEIFACLIEGWNEDSLATFQRLGYKPFPDIKYLTKRVQPDV
jgi:GNAT superfamily N-acetyltransferase